MTPEQPFGIRCAGTLRELRECAGLRVEIRPSAAAPDSLPDVNEAKEQLSKHLAPHIAVRFQKYYVRTAEVHAAWRSTSEPAIIGELCLVNLVECVTRWCPSLEDAALAPSDQSILASLKIMDQEPFAGSGRATGMRIANRNSEPEVWFYDMGRSRLERLDLDYGTYVENALVTKGAFGWQYLFAQVDLSRPEFREAADNMREALDRLPELFPGHSYGDLRNRLEARL